MAKGSSELFGIQTPEARERPAVLIPTIPGACAYITSIDSVVMRWNCPMMIAAIVANVARDGPSCSCASPGA
eukprot:3698406-Alexandrium_andersonii.AAC.1